MVLRLVHGFDQKFKISSPFLLAKKDLEKVFFAVLDRKQAILDYKNIYF